MAARQVGSTPTRGDLLPNYLIFMITTRDLGNHLNHEAIDVIVKGHIIVFALLSILLVGCQTPANECKCPTYNTPVCSENELLVHGSHPIDCGQCIVPECAPILEPPTPIPEPEPFNETAYLQRQRDVFQQQLDERHNQTYDSGIDQLCAEQQNPLDCNTIGSCAWTRPQYEGSKFLEGETVLCCPREFKASRCLEMYARFTLDPR